MASERVGTSAFQVQPRRLRSAGARGGAWRRLPAALAACALQALAAQTGVVVPAGNFGNEGHSAVVLPFHDQNLVLQQWLPPADVGLQTGVRIVGLAFLRETNAADAGGVLQSVGWTLDRVEVRLAPAAAAFGTDPVANWAAAALPAPAFAQDRFAVPAYASPAATGPGGVELVRLPFAAPVTHDASRPLLLEVRNVASNRTNRNPPAGGVVLADRSVATAFAALRGWGCANRSGAVPGFGAFTGLFVRGGRTTGQVTYPGTHAAAGFALLAGFQFEHVLQQAPGLPLRALPGLGGVPMGCRLWVDPWLAVPFGGGTFPQTVVLDVPAAAPAGLPVGWQALVLDAQADGMLATGPGLYAWVRTAPRTHGVRLALFVGDGDTSASAQPQPALTSAPIQDFALTVKLLVQ